jgi:hypothetical protein
LRLRRTLLTQEKKGDLLVVAQHIGELVIAYGHQRMSAR